MRASKSKHRPLSVCGKKDYGCQRFSQATPSCLSEAALSWLTLPRVRYDNRA
jgi:hypothetical protein